MASNSNPKPQLRALAPKPTPDSEPSSLSSQPSNSSQRPVFDDSAAGPPVTMPDQPFRDLAQRLDSPHRQLTIEQLVDTRLCVSSLSAQQCREVLGQLDDHQLKNAVYDRTLCFPFDAWTQNIRAMYGLQVQQDNKVVTSFENLTNHMESLFATWRDVCNFQEHDFANIGAHIKSYLCPSIDNIGVYGTYSDYTVTKVNALSALLKVGQIIVGIPILQSPRGVAMFEYDPLSRAVGNVLSTTTTDTTRRQILDLPLEGEFLELTKQANTVGLFPGLLQALNPGSQVCPYHVPRGDLLIPYSNKRASAGQTAPTAKRSKSAKSSQSMGQATLNKDRAATPGTSRASSHQPPGVTEGLGTEPSTPQNPFSRPSSAGPVAMPPFAKSTTSTPASETKVRDEVTKHEQIQAGQEAQSQDTELQGIAKGATDYQAEPQEGQQASKGVNGQDEQIEGSGTTGNTGQENQQQPQVQQAEQQAGTDQGIKPAYDDMLRRIENEVFHAHTDKTPDEQLQQAPAAVSLVEGTAGMILKQFQAAARACESQGRRDLFLASLHDTAFALLWVFESCALNVGCTPLAAEVSRTVSRDALVGALWGSVRLASPTECLNLLAISDHLGSETFGEKLERIIRQLDETGVVGFGDLRFVLGNMKSGRPVPAQTATDTQLDPSQK